MFRHKAAAIALSLVLLSSSLVVGDSTTSPSIPITTASLSEYLDVIFANIASNATPLGIVPLILPNVSQPIESKWYLPYEHLTLTDGTLINLQTIKRHGDCTLSYSNDTIEVRVYAAFTDLEVDYAFEAESSSSLLSLAGRLSGEVGQTQVAMDLTIDSRTMAIRAKKISFPGAKEIQFCIKSTILATWVVNTILEMVMTVFSSVVVEDVQRVVTAAFNNFFENDFPHFATVK